MSSHPGPAFSGILRRSALLGGSITSTGIASFAFMDLLPWSAFGIAESLYIALFAFLTFWLALSFWNSLIGAFAALTDWRQPGLVEPSPQEALPERIVIVL